MESSEEKLRAEHLARLGERYSRIFSAKEVDRHQTALGRLSPLHPVEILLDPRKDGTLECTVLAFDYPSEFSLITGILAGMGFSIVSGDTFNLGTTTQGTPITQTFTVRNTGTSALVISTDPPTVTGNFTASAFSQATIPGGPTATFSVTCTATAVGSPVTGTVSFANNDADENPFNFTVTCTVRVAWS